MTSGVYTDYDFEKHAQRVKKPVIEDMLDDSEGEETFRHQVLAEASLVRQRKGLPPPELIEEADLRYTERIEAAEQALQLGGGDSNLLLSGGDGDDEEEEDWDVESLQKRFLKSQSFSRHADTAGEEEEGDSGDYHLNSDEYYEENGRRETDLEGADLRDLANGDLAFQELLTQIRDSTDGSFNDIELDGKPIKTKSSRSPSNTFEPVEDPSEKEEMDRALAKLRDIENSPTFEDPFAECITNRGIHNWVEDDEEQLEELARQDEEKRKLEKISMLDADFSTYERVEQGALAALTGDKDRKPFDALAHIRDEVPAVSMQDIHDGYNLVYFGRPPNADYSAKLEERRRVNTHRAELAYQHMLDAGIKPTNKALTNFVGVYTEAGWLQDAEKALVLFDKHKIKATGHLYENLMQAYVRRKDLEGAHAMLATMRERKLVPTSNTFGLLMQTYSQHGLIVEALKVLEEATDRKVQLSERHVRHLRARCLKLGIKHPNMPADPLLWAKEAKLVRRQKKMASQRVIEPIRNLKF